MATSAPLTSARTLRPAARPAPSPSPTATTMFLARSTPACPTSVAATPPSLVPLLSPSRSPSPPRLLPLLLPSSFAFLFSKSLRQRQPPLYRGSLRPRPRQVRLRAHSLPHLLQQLHPQLLHVRWLRLALPLPPGPSGRASRPRSHCRHFPCRHCRCCCPRRCRLRCLPHVRSSSPFFIPLLSIPEYDLIPRQLPRPQEGDLRWQRLRLRLRVSLRTSTPSFLIFFRVMYYFFSLIGNKSSCPIVDS